MPSPIEIRLKSVSQLFNTLDPSPFREGDLDSEAEQYIVDHALERPAKSALSVLIHLPADAATGPGAVDIAAAIKTYFAGRGRSEARQIGELFRSGRRALAIGLAILSVCLLISWQLGNAEAPGALSRVAQESLVIIGWVAIWRPAEIFLYEWLPMARQRDLFRRLAAAQVSVVPTPMRAA